MNIRSRKELRRAAADALSAAPGSPKMVVLVYGGITCGLTLLSAFVSYMLANEIANTGGLANMGLRSVLSTIDTILPLVQTVVVLCLELGYYAASLNMLRSRRSEPRTLLAGFLRWGPLLRTYLLQGLIYFAVAFASLYISYGIFLMLPISEPFFEVMEPVLANMSALDTTIPAFDEATMAAAMEAMMPMMWMFAGIFCIAVIPVMYRYRMVLFCLADSDRPGALSAMHQSRMMMRRNRFALFKLDLSFWWYYLLQALITVIAYGDVLLPRVGIHLPMSDDVGYFLFYALSLAAQIVLYWFFLNRIQVTYAAAYDALRPQPQEPQYPVNI